MHRFSIAHISDLHLSGTGGDAEKVYDVLAPSILRVVPQDLPRILVITGDTVNSPSQRALKNALAFRARAEDDFGSVFLVRGNHDAKRWFGSFFATDAFQNHVRVDDDKVCDFGLHIFGFDSNSALFARGKANQEQFDRLLRARLEAEAQFKAGDQKVLRIAAIHHHPLPLAAGEGYKIGDVLSDEAYMYLESPGRLLKACMHHDIRMILHGHRHVEGIARYSIPRGEFDGEFRGSDERSWQTVYVLSCPSSSGRNCPAAGFNVLEFEQGSDMARVTIGRYRRPGNVGDFVLVDQNRFGQKIKISLFGAFMYDVSFDVYEALRQLPTKEIPEPQLYPLIVQLFRRRAFLARHEADWGHFYHAVVRTRTIWQNQIRPRLGKNRTQESNEIERTLAAMDDFLSRRVFKIDGRKQDELKDLDKEEFLKRLSTIDGKLDITTEIIDWRRDRLETLQRSLEQMRVGVGLLGTS
jgi:3',5'-cyclic-AMP phosphodiesterase